MLTREEEQALIAEESSEVTKTRSFRLTESTSDAFKQIAEEIGGNQQRTMEILIETYKDQFEKQNLKEISKLDDFEKYLSVLKDMYVGLLHANEDAYLLAQKDVSAQLESKDNIIIDLQNNLKKAEGAKKEAENAIIPLQQENTSLKETLKKEKEALEKEIRDIDYQLNELKSLNTGLKKDLEESMKNQQEAEKLYRKYAEENLKLQKEIETLRNNEKPLKENLSKVVSENRVLEKERERLEKEGISLNKELEALKSSHSIEIELVKSQAELKAKNEALEQIQEKQKELDEIKNRYLEKLEKKK